MPKEELIRTDHSSDLIVYTTEARTHVAVISISGDPGQKGAVYRVAPNPRVLLHCISFSAFVAAENYVRAIETETRHIDLCNNGRSPLEAA